MVRIFSIDPGTVNLGWAVMERHGDRVRVDSCGVCNLRTAAKSMDSTKSVTDMAWLAWVLAKTFRNVIDTCRYVVVEYQMKGPCKFLEVAVRAVLCDKAVLIMPARVKRHLKFKKGLTYRQRKKTAVVKAKKWMTRRQIGQMEDVKKADDIADAVCNGAFYLRCYVQPKIGS